MDKIIQPQEPEAFPTSPEANGSQPPSREEEQGDQNRASRMAIEQLAEKSSATSLAGSATGPRTLEGKEKSKRNAIKHGIFSGVVVLKGEARAQYESLLEELWRTLQPEGKLEELLVEKLAVDLWRQRRAIVAESAEIRKGIELLDFDLIQNIQDPNTLERYLKLLTKLQQGIKSYGFDQGRDTAILREIYGDEGHLQTNLYNSYLSWLKRANASEEGQRKGSATPASSTATQPVTLEHCKVWFLAEIVAEINRLNNYQKTCTSVESDRTNLEMLPRSIPDSPRLDHLLRYETTLSREIDRILNRLERLQRMRKGQPLPPQLVLSMP